MTSNPILQIGRPKNKKIDEILKKWHEGEPHFDCMCDDWLCIHAEHVVRFLMEEAFEAGNNDKKIECENYLKRLDKTFVELMKERSIVEKENIILREALEKIASCGCKVPGVCKGATKCVICIAKKALGEVKQ